jgi:hypothetical protein
MNIRDLVRKTDNTLQNCQHPNILQTSVLKAVSLNIQTSFLQAELTAQVVGPQVFDTLSFKLNRLGFAPILH